MSIEVNKDKISWLLDGCLVQVVASNEWLGCRILPLSVDQLRWRPRSGRWSIAACLDHLNRTFSYYIPKIEDALDREGNMRSRTHRPGFTELEEHFLEQMEPPSLVTMSAPTALVPASAVDPDEIVEQFPVLRARFAAAVRSIAGVDVLGVSVPDSLHPPVQSLGGVIGLLSAHERRHLWQAQQVLSAPEFPADLSAKSILDDCRGR